MASKNGSSSSACDCHCSTSWFVARIAATILLFLATVVAAVDVVLSHALPNGYVFGTSGGALAIIAFVISLKIFMKKLRKCRGCCCCGK